MVWRRRLLAATAMWWPRCRPRRRPTTRPRRRLATGRRAAGRHHRSYLIELALGILDRRRRRRLGGHAELRSRYRVQDADALLARQDVDDGVLEERDEDKYKTHGHPDVNSLDVGDARQRSVDAGRLRRHRQNGQ